MLPPPSFSYDVIAKLPGCSELGQEVYSFLPMHLKREHCSQGYRPHKSLVIYLFGDAAIFVQIIEVEGPIQPVIYCASQNNRQASHKILQEDTGERWNDAPFEYCNSTVVECVALQLIYSN